MKNKLNIYIIVFVILLSPFAFSQQKVTVNYTSDYTHMIKINGESVMKLVGNVYFYHNDALINCDTAYYYYQKDEFKGLSNVIINKKHLHIYGDKIIYNKNTNIAKVEAPIIKIIDSATVMYTRNLFYNTETSLAEFYGGATVTHNDNLLESSKGFYSTDKRLVMLRNDVSIQNPEYQIKTDSLDFYLDTEIVDYECRSYIWKENGDFLQADKGQYISPQKIFKCLSNSYVYTAEQELWADSISYYSLINELILNKDIQILDTTKRLLAFGDYGQYWRESENVLLTNLPSVANYFKDNQDTLFMRSDTLFIRPFLSRIDTVSDKNIPDSLKQIMTEQQQDIAIDSTLTNKFNEKITDNKLPINVIDTTQIVPIDTLKIDSIQQIQDTLTPKQDTIVDVSKLSKKELKAYKKQQRQKRKLERKEKFLQWLRDGGMEVVIDTVNLNEPKTNAEDGGDDVGGETPQVKDTTQKFIDIKNEADSSDYIIRGFHNTKVFRKDIQLVCDSLIYESVDSTATFIGLPVAWNSSNQIIASRIRSYMQNGELYRSRLFGKPILAQEVEKNRYNQIKGDVMDAMFRDNELYRLFVNSASQSIYYKQTEENEVEGLIYATSENMIIDVDSSEISTIKLYTEIETVTYPINKVPESQVRELDGFKWQIELKPTKKDVSDRQVRPTYRSEALKVEKPTFYITNAIENQKKLLMESGQWRERNEQIPLSKQTFKGIFKE